MHDVLRLSPLGRLAETGQGAISIGVVLVLGGDEVVFRQPLAGGQLGRAGDFAREVARFPTIAAQDVENALRAQNIEVPAGRVESADREFTVLAETDLRDPDEFAQIIVKNTDEFLVRLGDVARVEMGADSARFAARFNKLNAVPLAIVKQAVANPLDIKFNILLPHNYQHLMQI